MKKHLLLSALLTATVFAAQAQVALRPYVGINSHKLTEDFADANWKSNVGFQVGADFQIGSKFFVQPGIQIEFVKNTIESVPVVVEFDLKRTHLRVPVMIGYAFGSLDGNFSARLFTGPNASILLNSDSGDFDLSKDDFKSAVFGWNAGLGLDISILFIDLGYQFGLSEVFKNLDNSSKDNFFYANAGIRLKF